MSDYEYTYSPAQQEEIRKIREKYIPQEETTLDTLRRLDSQVQKAGTLPALILGTVGCLTFGVGMCCWLVWSQYALGCIPGLLGIAMMAAAYPVYKRKNRQTREKLIPEILRLTEELSR